GDGRYLDIERVLRLRRRQQYLIDRADRYIRLGTGSLVVIELHRRHAAALRFRTEDENDLPGAIRQRLEFALRRATLFDAEDIAAFEGFDNRRFECRLLAGAPHTDVDLVVAENRAKDEDENRGKDEVPEEGGPVADRH